MTKKTVAEEIIDSLQEFADVIDNGELIIKKFTCRKIILDLNPQSYDPAAVVATRKLLNVSQVVFAQFLGVSPKTVSSWEQGKTNLSDMACRFLDEIRRNPSYWQKRLRESVRSKTKDDCAC